MELKQSCRCQREYCGYLVLWRMPKRVQHSSTSFVVRSGELPDRQLKQMSCHTAQLGTVHNQCNSGQQLYTWLRSRLRHCPYSLIHIRFSLSLSSLFLGCLQPSSSSWHSLSLTFRTGDSSCSGYGSAGLSSCCCCCSRFSRFGLDVKKKPGRPKHLKCRCWQRRLRRSWQQHFVAAVAAVSWSAYSFGRCPDRPYTHHQHPHITYGDVAKNQLFLRNVYKQNVRQSNP